MKEDIKHFDIFVGAAKSFHRNNDSKTAAALAFHGLFALIPLFLVLLFLLGHYLVSSQTALKGLESLSSDLIPEFSRVIFTEVYSLSRSKSIWGSLSTLVLFWSIYSLFSAMRSSFSVIFNLKKESPYLRGKLLDALALLVILTLLIVIIISEIFYAKIVKVSLSHVPVLLHISNIVASLFITTLFLTIFYFVFSPVKLKINSLLTGSITTAVLWTVIRPAFIVFLTFNPNYGFAFGSLKAIFIILLWVYYFFSVLLFGAEIIANKERKTGKQY